MKKKIVLRNQRGSISLFVLLSILFFLVIVTGVATSTKNKETKTNAQIARVKAIYEKDVGNEQQIYNKKVQQQQSSKKRLTVKPNGGTWRDSTESTTISQDEGTELNLETPIPPSVTFNLDGGTLKGEEPESITFKEWQLQDGNAGNLLGNTYTFGNGNATITAIYNNTPVTLPDAEKSGYIFAGWFKDTTRVGGAESNYTPKGAVTLTAHWTEEATTNIELAFIDASGEVKHGTPNPLVLQGNQTSGTVTAPIIGAYTTGWEAKYWTAGYEPNSEQAVTSGGTLENVSANGTYYAIYEKELTLTYNANGGIGDDVPATQTRTITTNSFNLSNTTSAQVKLAAGTGLTKEGYTFAGWKSSTDNEVYEAGENFTLTEDTIMTAQWTEAIYTITYDLDGGNIESGNENPTSYTTETETFTLNNPTKTGYTFAGWTGTGLNNATNTVTVEQGSTGNRAYTATWTINTSNLTINPDGGTVSVKSPSSSEAEEISTSTPYIQNYNTTLKYETPTKADSTDKTTKYTVTYNTDGGSTAPANQDATITIVTEYEFDGWTKSTGFKGTLNETEKTYTFPADNNNTDTITATYTSSVKSTTVASVTLPAAPTKEGYTFAGWKSSTNNQIYNAGASYTPTANTTMTAQWELNSITFEDKTITKSFSTSAQTVNNGVDEATGGTGTYSYAITGGNNDNYFSLSGRNIDIVANTPAGTYTLTVTATDSNSGATKDATYTVTIENAEITGSVTVSGTNKVGETLTATPTTTVPSSGSTFSNYQWYYNDTNSTSGGEAIEGATNSTYTIGSSMKGKYIYVKVKASANNYNDKTLTSTVTEQVYVTITYQKGTGVSEIGKTTENVTGNTTLPTITASTGYTVDGWYNGDSRTADAGASYTPTDNITLTAKATPYSYTITLTAGTGASTVALAGWTNTGTTTMTKELEYGSTLDLSTVIVTNAAGYSGSTWAKTSGDGTLSGTSFTVGTGIATLTVTGTPNTYTITLNNQSATSAGTSEIYETYGTKYSLTSGGEAMTTSANGISVPTRTSYAFGGYYTDRNGEGTQIIDANGFLTSSASLTQFSSDSTIYAKWTDSVNPTLSTSIETYHEGFEDWELSGGAYVDGNGTLNLPSSDAVAKSRHYQAETAWYVMYDAYTTTAVSGSKGGSYFKSEYYDSTLTNINNKNGAASDDWKNTNITLSEWTNLSFSSNNKLYGGNIKYITLQFEENNSYGKTPERIKNFKVRGQLWSGFYDIKITASDGQSGINTIKYDSGNKNADYFATGGIAVSNNIIRVTENGTYTVCAEDKAGNRTVKTVTISKIDKTGPSNTAPTYTKTANSITVTNLQADSESGIYKVEYAIKESGGEYGDWQSSNEFTGLRSSTTYIVKTRATNKAYLKLESSETTVTTDTIEHTITLDNQGATTAGTGSIYEIYENRYSLASGGEAMTSSTNPIEKPEKTGNVFTGYYTEQNGAGTQIIDANGYLTSAASNTLFTSDDTIYANWLVNQYMVTFDARGGTSSEQTRPVSYNSALVSLPTANYPNHIFKGWYTEPSGGTQISESTTITGPVTFYAQWEDAIAEISGVYYPTLADAVADVTTSTPTTIRLVANTSENITISASQDITFDFGTNTLSNNGANVVINNNGTLTFASGTITTNANQIAVNNNSGATLYITGGTIEATGTEQAVYNNGGTVEISGGHISAIAKYENSNKRGTVHNQTGTMTITGGTIVSSYKTYGGYNTGVAVTTKVTTLTVGVKDGIINTTSPEIVGERYGINNEVAFNIYDGNIKGKNGTTAALVSYASNKIGDKETNYKISHGTVDSYDCVFFVATHKVTFNPNGGTVATTSKNVEERKPLGTLPLPTRAGYAFQGWFTGKTDGTEVTEETLMGNDDITYYAHWEVSPPAEVDGQQYDTIQKAVDSNPSGTEIEVIADATESLTIPKNKEITINLNGHSLSNNGTSIIKNNGTLTVNGGTLNTNRADASSIDNNPGGTLVLDGVRIVAIGTDTGAKNKQALFNDNGTVTIRGDSYFESKSSGTYNSVPRSTIHNINGGTMTIESATVINNLPLALTPNDKNAAISNGPNSTLIIGKKDGLYNQDSLKFIGRKYGIYNAGTLKYYDGTFSGITASTYSTAAASTEIEDYYDQDDMTEEITLEGEEQSATYHKRFLLAPITITPSTLEPEFPPLTVTIRYNSTIVSGKKAGFGTTPEEAEANASESTANSLELTTNGYVYAEGIDSNGETKFQSLEIKNIIIE